MVGLAVDQLIADPIHFVKQLHFPGDPPGTKLDAAWLANNMADLSAA